VQRSSASVHRKSAVVAPTLSQSEQVITPIGGWAENGALSRGRQYLSGFDQQCSRQCRTIRIEDNRRGMFARKYFLDRLQQAIAEVRQTRIDQADVRRQGVVKKRLGPCRRESNVAGNRRTAPRRQQIARHIVKESRIERCGLISTCRFLTLSHSIVFSSTLIRHPEVRGQSQSLEG
jgi:hypothetical protein